MNRLALFKFVAAFIFFTALMGCEKTPIEKAGIIITEDSPVIELMMAQMIPGEPVAFANENIEKGSLRLYAYETSKGVMIPAVSSFRAEDYAITFGLRLMPGMGLAETENQKKIQEYFLNYAKAYNERVIKYKFTKS